ncbi:arginine repressor [Holosporaceae bacterium 'Namur']|nr:arginine repressor [Holosporaceae bacterium 'Namur']
MIEELILEIIKNEKISSQDALVLRVEELSQEHVEQSTLSRKLKKLNIEKENGIYKLKEKKNFFSRQVIKYINISEPNLLIIKTIPGVANSIAIIIDNEIEAKSHLVSEIAGTIAGDDTIFIAVKNPSKLHLARKQVEELIM